MLKRGVKSEWFRSGVWRDGAATTTAGAGRGELTTAKHRRAQRRRRVISKATRFWFFRHTRPDRKRSEEDAGAAEPASSARTVPADACVRMVGGRVREILDLLARSDGDMACADARRLQRLLKSVIRALDDLRADCCRTPPRQVNNNIILFLFVTAAVSRDRLKSKIESTHNAVQPRVKSR